MIVPADILAGKLLVQLGYVTTEQVRAGLRETHAAPDASQDLLTRLAWAGLLDRPRYAQVRRFVALFEHVRYEAGFLRTLEEQRPVPIAVYDLIAELELGAYRQRLGTVLLERGELSEQEVNELDTLTCERLQREDARAISRYVQDDFVGVDRPLIRGRPVDDAAFRLPVLFRSEQTLAEVNQAVQRLRAELGLQASGVTGPPAASEPLQVNTLLPDEDIACAAADEGLWHEETKRFVAQARLSPPALGQADPGAGAGVSTPQQPLHVGPYVVEERLGKGGMGQVFLARRDGTGPLVAVKTLLQSAKPEDRRRFEREADILALLSHPNTLSLIERGQAEGLVYLVMPAITGETLRELIVRSPAGLPPERAFDIIEQVLAGVEAIHQVGVVHRDLKPSNIVVTLGRGAVKIIDFGIARHLDQEQAREAFRTATGAISGSPAYVAPETIAGDQIGPRTDIYSLGCVFMEVLTGKAPFSAPSPYAYLREHMVGAPRTLSSAAPDRHWSPDLEELLARMLAKDPETRPTSCQEILDRLQGGLRQRSLKALGAGKNARTGFIKRLFQREP